MVWGFKDLALSLKWLRSLLQCRFNPSPKNFCMMQAQPKKTKRKEKKISHSPSHYFQNLYCFHIYWLDLGFGAKFSWLLKFCELFFYIIHCFSFKPCGFFISVFYASIFFFRNKFRRYFHSWIFTLELLTLTQ